MKKWITIISVMATTALPCLAKLPLDVTLPKTAKLGQKIIVKVKTGPELKCKIEAQDAGLTQSLKLLEQKADKGGNAKWTFEIPKDYKADEMPIIVTAVKDKEEEKSTNSIKINR